MSQNDLIHLESNFKNWNDSRGADLHELDPFVYYCAEQFLKPFDLNDDEIAYGIVDGPNDGGVDAIYCIVNGDILMRDDIELDPKTVTRIRLVIMQIKSSGGFSPVEIDKFYFFTDDLLDLSQPAQNFKIKYNGITVIAASVSNAGHKRLSLEDPQIVNGLQTSREIFSYFAEQQPTNEERSILVKVIETGDPVISDGVIKATNSQNKMPAASLRATDPIHHQIEDLFRQ